MRYVFEHTYRACLDWDDVERPILPGHFIIATEKTNKDFSLMMLVRS